MAKHIIWFTHDDNGNVNSEMRGFEKIMNNFIAKVNNNKYYLPANYTNLLIKNSPKNIFPKGYEDAIKDVFASQSLVSSFKMSLDSTLSNFQSLTQRKISLKSLEAPDALTKIQTAGTSLNDLANSFDEFMRFTQQILNSKDLVAAMANQQLFPNISPVMRKLFKTLIDNNQTTVIQDINSTFNQLRGRLAPWTRIKQAMGRKRKFSNYLASYQGTSEDFRNYVQGLVDSMMTISGYIHEAMVTAGLQSILNTLAGSMSNITVTGVGYSGNVANKGRLKFKTSTADIILDASKGVGQAKVSFPLGASLKRATVSSRGMAHVSIKSNSRLKQFIDLAVHHNLLEGDTERIAFYNILANHGRKTNRGEQSTSDPIYQYSNLGQMLLTINKMSALFGLSGSFKRKDMSYLFIVNDKIYSIADILQNMNIGGSRRGQTVSVVGGMTRGIQKSIAENHHWIVSNGNPNKNSYEMAMQRSNAVKKTIEHIKINLALNIRVNQLKTIGTI